MKRRKEKEEKRTKHTYLSPWTPTLDESDRSPVNDSKSYPIITPYSGPRSPPPVRPLSRLLRVPGNKEEGSQVLVLLRLRYDPSQTYG